MGGLLQPGPTLAAAEELRSKRGSRGLLDAVGTPLSYAPNPAVQMIGQGLLGARYLTGEADPTQGLASLSDMTAMLVGSRLPPAMRNVIPASKSWFRGMSGEKSADRTATTRGVTSYTTDPEVASMYALQDLGGAVPDPRQAGKFAAVHKVNIDPSQHLDMTPYMEGAKKYGVESAVTYGDAVKMLKDLGMTKEQADDILLSGDIPWQRKYGRSGWDNWYGMPDVPKANTPMVAQAAALFEGIARFNPEIFNGKPGVFLRGSLGDPNKFVQNKVPFHEAKVYDELRQLDESLVSPFWGGLLSK